MANLNKMLIIGFLGQDPEKKVTPNGNSVATVSIATTEKFNDKSGNKQEETEWHRVVFWNKQADLIAQYCKKGSQVYVEGKLKTREWKDKDGNKRWSTEVIASSFQFLDSKGQQQQPNQQQDQQYNYKTASGNNNNPQTPPDDIDGVPF